MNFKKEELIKSPLNYTGGKFKLLPQILPLFPNNIDTFYDLFSGGGNVAINVSAKKIICNDIEEHVISLFNYFKKQESDELIKSIENIIKEYGLSNTLKNGYNHYKCNSSDGVSSYNKRQYEQLREDYNKNTTNDLLFYTVILFAFNNQIRFNSKKEFNMPVNKRDFNRNIKKNLKLFIDKLNSLDIDFWNSDFRNLKADLNTFKPRDLIYCDPPYLITLASYNEKNGWNEEHERELLQLLDNIHNQGCKFALSNVLEHKGKTNKILKKWSQNYNIYYLDNNYNNCNYHSKDKGKNSTVEVLITNY